VIAPLGKVVAPDTGPEVAEATGMKRAAEQPLLYREVIGKVLSIVYFPFWVVEMHTARNTLLTILDAVSQSVVRSVVRTETPDSIYSVFNNPLKGTPEIVGFRPITCPNCGWDLPVRPDDAIFFCTTCGSAWQIEGKELFGVRHTFAEIGYFSSDCEIRYLPFWVLLTERIESESFRFFIPGFRCRRLKFLLDLALRISRLQPVYSPSEQKGVEPSSCCYDREDASLLARFTQACLLSRRIEDFRDAAKHAVSVKNAELVCFPFRLQGEYLIAPFGDMAIPKGLLL
jgi:hypothetical protein